MGRVRCVGHLGGTEGERGVQGYWGDRSGRRHLAVQRGRREYRGIGETGLEEGIWRKWA